MPTNPTDDDDPMAKLRRLGEALRDVAEPLGLELRKFVPVVDFELDHGHVIQAVFTLNEVQAQISEEQADYDERFAELEANFQVDVERDVAAEAAEKIAQTRDRMLRKEPRTDDTPEV